MKKIFLMLIVFSMVATSNPLYANEKTNEPVEGTAETNQNLDVSSNEIEEALSEELENCVVSEDQKKEKNEIFNDKIEKNNDSSEIKSEKKSNDNAIENESDLESDKTSIANNTIAETENIDKEIDLYAGDSINNATSLAFGKEHKDTLIKDEEKDYYKFTLSKSGNIKFRFSGRVQYMNAFLYDQNFNKIWYLTHIQWNGNTQMLVQDWEWDLTQGTYYIVFEAMSDNQTGAYSVKAEYTSANETNQESSGGNNNSIESSSPIIIGKNYNGQIAINDKKDYYNFEIKESGRITLNFKSNMSIAGMYIYDENGTNVLTTSLSDYSNANIVETLKLDLVKGKYYILITQWYSSDTGNYSFSTKYKSANESFKESNDFKNNTFENANLIKLGKTYNGQIALNDEIDFYKFTVGNQKVDLYYNGNIYRTHFAIYDINGEEIWSPSYQYSSSNTGKLIRTWTLDLGKGTYYLRLYDNDNTGQYFFDISNHFPFSDVSQNDWYYSATKEVYNLGLMTGTSETTFSPNQPMSRAMVATVLYKMAGNPKVSGTSGFPDVANNKWYTKAVTWATKNKIINGYGNGTFKPDANVTREELSIMLYNYAKKQGINTSKLGSIDSFKDKNKVSSYATKAMRWAVGNKIITGSANNLKPKSSATRAECAKMLLQVYKMQK